MDGTAAHGFLTVASAFLRVCSLIEPPMFPNESIEETLACFQVYCQAFLSWLVVAHRSIPQLPYPRQDRLLFSDFPFPPNILVRDIWSDVVYIRPFYLWSLSGETT